MFWDDDDDLNLDDEPKVRRLSLRQLFDRVRPLFRPHRARLLLALLLIVIVVTADLIGPLLLREVLDEEIPDGNVAGIVGRGIAYAALTVTSMGIAFGLLILMVKLGLRVITGLRQKVFAHVLTLSLGHFDKNPPGKLMARVESDVERLLILFSEVGQGLALNLFKFLGTFVVLLCINARATLLILSFLIPLLVITPFLLRYVRHRYQTVRRLYAKVSGFLTEYVQNIPVLQIYGYTRRAAANLHVLNRDKLIKETRLAFVEYGYWGVFASWEIVIVMVIVYFSAPQVLGEAMTVGELVVFIVYLQWLFWPLLQFSEQLNFVQRAFSSADRVFALLDTPSRTPDRPGASAEVPADWHEIAFENVSFAYDGGTLALEELSFRVKRGEKIAFVGLSGGGKTTVTSLLLRFYEPTEGRITLDGVDIRDYQQQAWRKKIGLVLQDIHLFPGTLGENLRVLRDDIPHAAMERAVAVVDGEEMVERLPEGFDTELSEGGANLSMGERQLLCFARAIVENPDFLILDEATSSVDPVTEQRIQASLDSLMEGRTSLIVAHRLATITKADRILVLHQGRLEEEGTHEQLYRQQGLYRDLFDLQFAAKGAS